MWACVDEAQQGPNQQACQITTVAVPELDASMAWLSGFVISAVR
jgi:hypothetical protein